MSAAYLPTRRSLLVAHRKRLVYGLRSRPLVPRIDRDTRPESAVTVRARELAQDQRAVPLLLALHELMRTERHTLAQTRDHEGVRNSEERELLAERQVLRVQEYDRLIRQGGEARVDVRDHL